MNSPWSGPPEPGRAGGCAGGDSRIQSHSFVIWGSGGKRRKGGPEKLRSASRSQDLLLPHLSASDQVKNGHGQFL